MKPANLQPPMRSTDWALVWLLLFSLGIVYLFLSFAGCWLALEFTR